jgi:two-component system, sensor histidine kinase
MSEPAVDSKLRMLVVDDDHDCADSLRVLLELSGHDVRVAYGGVAALEIAREFRPRVVFSDVEMPGLHGAELARRLRQMPELADVVIIAASAIDPVDGRLAGHHSQFDEWLRKPYGLAALQSILARLVGSAER